MKLDGNEVSRHDSLRVFTRREALTLFGAAGLSLCGRSWAAAGDAASAMLCVVRPRQGEGPFFIDGMIDRSDIRLDPVTGEGAKGTPLRLDLVVAGLAAGNCAPLPGAKVDVWHCDADGRYSVSESARADGGPKWLRGQQTTGADGVASFVTIYPGAYAGRAVHIHFKVRAAAPSGRWHEFTSQIYFDEAISDRVYSSGPYPSSTRRMRNADDYLYRLGGAQLTLVPTPSDDGLAARFHLGLALS